MSDEPIEAPTPDIPRCKDCDYVQRFRVPASDPMTVGLWVSVCRYNGGRKLCSEARMFGEECGPIGAKFRSS